MTFSFFGFNLTVEGLWDLSWILWAGSYIAPDMRVKKALSGPRTDEESAEWFEEKGKLLAFHLPLLDSPDVIQVLSFSISLSWYSSFIVILRLAHSMRSGCGIRRRPHCGIRWKCAGNTKKSTARC